MATARKGTALRCPFCACHQPCTICEGARRLHLDADRPSGRGLRHFAFAARSPQGVAGTCSALSEPLRAQVLRKTEGRHAVGVDAQSLCHMDGTGGPVSRFEAAACHVAVQILVGAEDVAQCLETGQCLGWFAVFAEFHGEGVDDSLLAFDGAAFGKQEIIQGQCRIRPSVGKEQQGLTAGPAHHVLACAWIALHFGPVVKARKGAVQQVGWFGHGHGEKPLSLHAPCLEHGARVGHVVHKGAYLKNPGSDGTSAVIDASGLMSRRPAAVHLVAGRRKDARHAQRGKAVSECAH
ncbi:conserved hypothetical protein [Nitratidesulfovibrio vulgaris DP4]|uniref:Uncharacterized protein n=1 Tax=Nitratidesulfovibrio vulgaris (strain DP4) TaxID=391774 RepID=A0A0H3A4Z1_NITV4|nr:conserved hypothetical protein [Nitratidesulfovibrio vulgaris DP4]